MRRLVASLTVLVVCALVVYAQPSNTSDRLRAGLDRLSQELVDKAAEAAPLMREASSVLDKGICMYAGFCRSNPALSCAAVMAQEGVAGFTVPPDGKYWIKPTLNSGASPIREVECMHSQADGGWMLLFDDRDKDLVTQTFDPVVEQVPVMEVLAFTAGGNRSSVGAQAYIYNVDISVLKHQAYGAYRGRTMHDVLNTPWVGQDGEGRRTNFNATGVSLYPHNTHHYRFKYVSRPAMTYGQTLYVLDDGDVGPDACRQMSPQSGSGTCYKEAKGSPFAQTCYDPRGLISFGCSDSVDRFVHGCGTCLYNGHGDQSQEIKNTVVRRMFVR